MLICGRCWLDYIFPLKKNQQNQTKSQTNKPKKPTKTKQWQLSLEMVLYVMLCYKALCVWYLLKCGDA